jgi:hypothetical protein
VFGWRSTHFAARHCDARYSVHGSSQTTKRKRIRAFFERSEFPEIICHQPMDSQGRLGFGESEFDFTALVASLTEDPETSLRPKDNAGAPATPTDDRQWLREALIGRYIDLLARDDAQLVERMRWWPAMKRPSIGLQWGLGVTYAGKGEPPQVNTESDLETLTGSIGTGIVRGVNRRVADGRFGVGPSDGVQPVVLLGSGEMPELLKAAQHRGLHALIVLDLSLKAGGLSGRVDRVLRVRLLDAASKKALFSSEPLSSRQLMMAQQQGQDLAVGLVEDVLRAVDGQFTLKPMPEMRPEHVTRRVSSLLDSHERGEDPWPLLIELRYYQVRGLLGEAAAGTAFERVVGDGRGEALATGTEAQRRTVLASLPGS